MTECNHANCPVKKPDDWCGRDDCPVLDALQKRLSHKMQRKADGLKRRRDVEKADNRRAGWGYEQ